MNRQIIIGYTTEGPTDIKFLKDVIRRTFIEISLECTNGIELLDIIEIPKYNGLPYTEQIREASLTAFKYGVEILCIHTDADSPLDTPVLKNKIHPALETVKNDHSLKLCRCIVPVIPIQMMEAWMLADKELLKKEIGTNKSDNELQINREPESFSDPKETISNAIRIARQEISKRRRKELTIAQLYINIGENIKLDKLDRLPSYQKFKESVRDAYRAMKLLH